MTTSPGIVAMAAAAVVGCSADDQAAVQQPYAKGRVTSSIPEGAELSEPVPWRAWVTGVPPSEVASVRFVIDGKVAAADRRPPYEFRRRGQRLAPSTLGRGSHTLAVDARLAGGRRLTTASTAIINERKAP